MSTNYSGVLLNNIVLATYSSQLTTLDLKFYSDIVIICENNNSNEIQIPNKGQIYPRLI